MKKILMAILAVVFITLLLPLAVIFIMGHTQSVAQGEVSLYITGEDRIVTLSEKDYLCGALISYMPADYNSEALKAGAVALRSFLYAKKDSPSDRTHSGAMVCDDFTHCQSYTSRQVPQSIQDAVNDTEGEIIKKDSAPVSDISPLKIYDAQNRAKEGMRYGDILKIYFEGVEITNK